MSEAPGEPDLSVEADDDLPEQMRIRREKREELAARGMEPYAIGLPITTTIAAVRAAHPGLPEDTSTGDHVGIAGRVIFSRNTGKLCFATLRAGDGSEIQAMVSLASVGEQQLADWKDLVDIGDHVFVAGEVITSRRGELSVLADEWRMAAKALRPLPVAHKPLNEETRVRQRYVDLVVRPEAQAMARTRVAVVASIRQSLTRRGFLEIETPMLQTLHGGATARPFVTHSNAFDIDVFLRIAPELFLKRAVVGGLERVFEVNRNFRNEGADRTHSPEFTMLEFYQAYADYQVVATITRELIQEAALAACGSLTVTHHDGTVLDLSGVWPQVGLYESLSDALGEAITPDTDRSRLVGAVRARRDRVPRRRPSTASSWRSSSSTTWCRASPARRSSWTTRSTRRRWCGRTARSPEWSRSGTCTSTAPRRVPGTPSSWTPSCSGSGSSSRQPWPIAETPRRCTLTRTSCGPWSTACRRWAGSESASTAC